MLPKGTVVMFLKIKRSRKESLFEPIELISKQYDAELRRRNIFFSKGVVLGTHCINYSHKSSIMFSK
jgi:hypothetical protein